MEQGDAISRSAVHIAINSQIFDTEYPSELDELERQIDELPALDVAPVVHSYWDEYENTIICKACGEKWSIREDGDFVIIEAKDDLKFCPSCGARMDGEPE